VNIEFYKRLSIAFNHKQLLNLVLCLFFGQATLQAQPFSVTTFESTAYTFSAADFEVDGLVYDQIEVQSLPDKGTLAFDGAELAAPYIVEFIDFEKLVYAPENNESGDAYTSFQFQRQLLLVPELSAQTMTINVTANAPPTLDQPSIDPILMNAAQQTVNLSGITDGGEGDQTLTVTATSDNAGLVPDPTVTYTSPNATGVLNFTPVTDQFGTANITVTVNDGISSTERNFEVIVNAPPTLGAIGDISILQNAPAQTVSLSGISDGGENNQTITITAISDNTGLIPNPNVIYTSPNATGSLSFTPVPGETGSAIITVTVSDGITAHNVNRTFTVTVTGNNPPTLNAISNVFIAQNAPQQSIALNGITDGDDNSQTLSVTATSDNTALISNPVNVNYTSPNTTGTLTFTPISNQSGVANITVTVNDGMATTSRTFEVRVNTPPTLNSIGNLSLTQNASEQTVNLGGITDGGEGGQTLTVTASSNNTTLIPNPAVAYTSPQATGSLSFTPVNNQTGMATITVTVNDGFNNFTRNFTVSVNPNLPPTLDAISNITIPQNAPQQTVNLTGISDGGEGNQTISFTATSNNTGLIPNPTVNYTSPNATGTLNFTAVAGQTGSAIITVTVSDGFADDDFSRTFTVTVSPNQPPTIDKPADLLLRMNDPQQTVNLTGITDGGENNQTLTVTASSNNTALIPNPTVTYTSPNTTGSLSFTPVNNQFGVAIITVSVNDGITTSNQNFEVRVNAPPTLDAIGNITIIQNAPAQTVALTGISTGGETGQSITITAISSNPTLIPNPTITYTSPNATGSLAFTPVPDEIGTAEITVTVSDGIAAHNVSRTFTVTVNANNPPTLNAIANRTIVMNAGQQTVNLAGISDGDGGVQTLSVSASSNNTTLIPAVTVNYTPNNATGNIRFTPATDQFGIARITVTVSDGVQNFSRSFNVTVNAPPTLDPIGDISLLQDAPEQTVNLSGISDGGEGNQTITISASSANTALIPNPTVEYTSPATTGTLRFTPVAGQTGAAIITVVVSDGIAAHNRTRTFTVAVNQNNPPTINSIADITIPENAPLQTVNLSGISDGDNGTQVISVSARSSDIDIIPDPVVNYTSPNATGTLQFTPIENQFGEVTITVTLNDGQTDNNITEISFKVSIIPFNRPPTIDPIADISIPENATQQTVNLSGIGPGAAFETDQVVSITANSNNTALIPNPTVQYTSPNETGTVRFTPVADQFGEAIITVRVDDGQAENNITTRAFVVTVVAANRPPTLDPIADIEILEDADLQVINLTGITPGPSFENQTVTISAVSDNTDLIAAVQAILSSPTGPTGTLRFRPEPDQFGVANITVTVTDNATPEPASIIRTFRVTVLPIADDPIVTNAVANEGQLNAEGLVIQRNPVDGVEVTHFRITNITGGTLYLNNGTTVINNNTFITVAQGNAGLKFRPSGPADGSFNVQASLSNTIAGLGGSQVTALIEVNSRPRIIGAGIPDVSLVEDDPVFTIDLSNKFEDTEDPVTNLSFEVLNIENPGLFESITVNSINLNILLAKDQNGQSDVTIRCTDSGGAFIDQTFTVFVEPVNDPPVFDLSRSLVSLEVNFTGTETVTAIPAPVPEDEKNQVVTYSLQPSTTDIANVSINPSTGTISITARPNAVGFQEFQVIADDGQAENNIHIESLSINIGFTNTPPVFSVSGDLIVNEDFEGTRVVEVNPDPVPEWEQDQVVRYSISPAWVDFIDFTFDENTGNATFTAARNRFGERTFTITANDGQAVNNTFSRNFVVRVNPINDPPTIDPIASPIVIDENSPEQSITLTGIGPGPFEDDQTVFIFATSSNANIIPNPTVEYTNPESTAILRFSPVANAFGKVTITVNVFDNGPSNPPNQNKTTRTFEVEVVNLNSPPFFNPVNSPIEILEDAPEQIISLSGINAGPNETQDLRFIVNTDNPDLFEYIRINYVSPATTGNIRFKPAPNANGEAEMTIRLEDDGINAPPRHVNNFSRTVKIIVTPVNDPPEFVSTPPLQAFTGERYTYNVEAIDVDEGDILRFEVQEKPDWLTFTDNGDGTALLTGIPEESDRGNHPVRLAVYDLENAVDFQNFSIQVIIRNRPPTITSEPVLTATENAVYTYNVTASDPDPDDRITFRLDQGPNWLILNNIEEGRGRLTGIPPLGSSGTYNIVIRATDRSGEFVIQEFTLVVNRFNNRPVLSNINVNLDEDTPFQFTKQIFVNRFNDADGDELVSIRIDALPANGALTLGEELVTVAQVIEADDLDRLIYMPRQDYFGFDEFTWNATDGRDFAINSARVNLVINPVNDPPVLSNIETFDLQFDVDEERAIVTQTIRVSDVDNVNLIRAMISISAGYVRGEDSLKYIGNSLRLEAVFNDTTGVLSINGLASLNEYEEAMRSIEFISIRSQRGAQQNKAISFVVFDGEDWSNTVERTIRMVDNFIPLDIPSGFTPNGDFENDTWNILNIEWYPDCVIEVFSQNGNRVFRSIGYDFEWDGTFNGQPLPAGVYYYTIDLKRYSARYNGSVTILR
jgi:gliding motility-associated-like protein